MGRPNGAPFLFWCGEGLAGERIDISTTIAE